MYDQYESPLSSRYASRYMLELFSATTRIRTWRKLWTELARAEMEMGLPITEEQVAALESHIEDIDFETAAKREKEVEKSRAGLWAQWKAQHKESQKDIKKEKKKD